MYVCWARFTASGPNNGVFLASSSDGGRTFRTQKVSSSVHGSQFCDIAVTRSGAVYVVWRQFAFKPDRGQLQDNAVAWVKSTNGGRSFTKPAVAAPFTGWDPGDQTSSASACGAAKFAACLAADGTLGAGAGAGPEPRAFARDCGDGPLACQSGYVFHRMNTQVRITRRPDRRRRPRRRLRGLRRERARQPGTDRHHLRDGSEQCSVVARRTRCCHRGVLSLLETVRQVSFRPCSALWSAAFVRAVRPVRSSALPCRPVLCRNPCSDASPVLGGSLGEQGVDERAEPSRRR